MNASQARVWRFRWNARAGDLRPAYWNARKPMKLGLISDIHEQVAQLHNALDRFDKERVDQVVVLGDVFEMGEHIEETCRLLAAANAIGVWGNHDYGLCFDSEDEVRTRYPSTVIDYMTSLRPRLDVAGCHFTHVEPWLNPEDLTDLWYFEGPPEEHGKLQRIFNAVPNRMMFAGHFHSWLLCTPDGIAEWKGERPIRLLDDQRYFVVIGALCEGATQCSIQMRPCCCRSMTSDAAR